MAETNNTVATQPTIEGAAKTDAATLHGQTTQSTEQASGESGGLPQFQFQYWPGQIAYLVILFALLYVLMSRVFAPRIRKVFDERATVINEALSSARTVQSEAAAHAEDARKAVDAARTQAERTAADAKAKSADEAKSAPDGARSGAPRQAGRRGRPHQSLPRSGHVGRVAGGVGFRRRHRREVHRPRP